MRRLSIDPLWMLALVLVLSISVHIALGSLWPLRAAPAVRTDDYGYSYQTTVPAAPTPNTYGR